MKITNTLLLALFLSGLGYYYFVWDKNPKKAEGSELDPVKIFSLARGDSLAGLEIDNRITKEKMTLRKKGSDWRLEFPVSYPADNFLVEGLANALLFTDRLKRFPSEMKAAPEFGFDSPPIRIGIETEKGRYRRYLVIGKESPVKTGVYAHWEGERESFLIPFEVKAALERTVYSLRQKKLFRLPVNEVSEIGVKTLEREYRLEKRGEKWQWVLPSRGREIPLEKVSDLIYAFHSLYIREFLDGRDPSEGAFGLKRPDAFLALGFKGRKAEKVLLGARAEGKDAFYARREKDPLVFLISEEHLRSLMETVASIFHEGRNGDTGKTPGNSREDSTGVPTGREKSR